VIIVPFIMDNAELSRLEKVYQNWSTEDLVKATTVDKNDYQLEAIQLMQKELAKRNIPYSELESLQTTVKSTKGEQAKSLNGIKGFLLLFVVGIFIASSQLLIAGLLTLPEVLNSSLVAIMSLIFILFGGYGFFTFVFLIRKNVSAPRHARTFLILCFILSIIITVFQYLPSGIGDLKSILSIFNFLFWLMYIQQSKRVKATYGIG